MNLQTIYTKLQADLQEVVDDGKLAVVYPYPKPKIDQFPAAVFYPVSTQSIYNTQKDNAKTYQFAVPIIYTILDDSDTDMEEVYTNIMPDTMDAIIQKLDDKWNVGDINGRIMWMNVDSGDWVLSNENEGPTLTAFLLLTYNVITDIN